MLRPYHGLHLTSSCVGLSSRQVNVGLDAAVQDLFNHFLGTLQAACVPVQLGTGADYRRLHPGSQAGFDAHSLGRAIEHVALSFCTTRIACWHVVGHLPYAAAVVTNTGWPACWCMAVSATCAAADVMQDAPCCN